MYGRLAYANLSVKSCDALASLCEYAGWRIWGIRSKEPSRVVHEASVAPRPRTYPLCRSDTERGTILVSGTLNQYA
jgi:hypothetical protein